MRGQRQEKNDDKKEARATFHFSYDICELHTYGMFLRGEGGEGGQVRRGKKLAPETLFLLHIDST